MKALTIAKVAKQAGVGVETIRFYERSGLLEEPPRNDAGYRQYQPEAIVKLCVTIQHSNRWEISCV